MSNTKPLVSVIVLAWNGQTYLEPCLTALLAQDYTPCQVIVVDNGSQDRSVEIAQRFAPRLELVRNRTNLGFAGGVNVGIRHATGEIIVLLNQDTEVQPGWLHALVDAFAQDSTVGIVGSKALYPNGRVQHAGGYIRPGDAFAFHVGRNEEDDGQAGVPGDVEYVTGTSFALHRRVLEAIGGLDEGFYPAYYEEIDYCYRARRAGFRIVYQPKSLLVHHESTSLPAESYALISAFHRNRVRFVLRHWTGEELASFVEAEKRATAETKSIDDAVARGRAYWRNLVQLRQHARARQSRSDLGAPLPESDIRWLATQLENLEERAYRRIRELLLDDFAPADERAPEQNPERREPGAPETSLPLDLDSYETLLQQLGENAPLREHRFRSRIPVLGPLIAGFRSLWLSVAARGYILPVLHQQSHFNAQVVHALQHLNVNADQERRLLAAESHLRDLDRTVRHQAALADALHRMFHQDTLALLEMLSARQAPTEPETRDEPSEEDHDSRA